MLAIKELLGSKLKFGLIALAIGLVVSLTMVTSAMSEGLLTGMAGAKSSLAADALVFQRDTYPTLERSHPLGRRPRGDRRDARAWRACTASVTRSQAWVPPTSPFDVRVFGLGDRHRPAADRGGHRGRRARAKRSVDVTAKLEGIELGDTLTLTPVETRSSP